MLYILVNILYSRTTKHEMEPIKLIHFKNKSKFDEYLENNTIIQSSLVFIKDTQLIWTHGQFYNKSEIEITDGEIPTNNVKIWIDTSRNVFSYLNPSWDGNDINQKYIPFPILDEAPKDGKPYNRKDGTWVLNDNIAFKEIILENNNWINHSGTPIKDSEPGFNLKGQTIKFDISKPLVRKNTGNEGILICLGGAWAVHVEVYDTAIVLYANGEVVYHSDQGGWKTNSYTFPDDKDSIVVYMQPGSPLDLSGNNFAPLEDILIVGESGKGEWSSTIEVNGIDSTMTVIGIPIVLSEDVYNKAGLYQEIDSSLNSITLYSRNKPTGNINLNLAVIKF